LQIREYLGLLRRWWWLILIVGAIGSVIGYVITSEPTQTYTATTTVLLSQGNTSTIPDANAIATGQRLAATYSELLKTRSVLEKVSANLQLNTSPDSLTGRISVASVQGTNLLRITVRDTDPQRSANIANEIVRVFILQNSEIQASRYASSSESLQEEINQLQIRLDETQSKLFQHESNSNSLEADLQDLQDIENEEGLSAQQAAQKDELERQLVAVRVEQQNVQLELAQIQARYQALLKSYEDVRLLQAQASDILTVVEPAITGTPAPIRNQKGTNAIQGGIAGMVLVAGTIFLIEQLRVTINSTDEVEKALRVPALAVIANMKGTENRLITASQPRSPISEAYRVLRTNLDFAAGESAVRTIVVTSTAPGEGKTTTAANLAITIAQSGKRVILVDTDLRRPTLHKLFKHPNTRGVTTALLEQSKQNISHHLVETEIEGLSLMTSGPLPPNPADLISSQAMINLITQLKDASDIVIFDSPPILAVADATLLSRICDASLLVVLSKKTKIETLIKAREQLSQAGAKLYGAILNRVQTNEDSYYYHYYSS
jgi:capsular exopolysaccharide synthesis family protein